uniref:Uncharacterized protein n=1 Tax=Opuntia streptacantha TaxID=393608 RepID=A0A7C8YIN0_OPUST
MNYQNRPMVECNFDQTRSNHKARAPLYDKVKIQKGSPHPTAPGPARHSCLTMQFHQHEEFHLTRPHYGNSDTVPPLQKQYSQAMSPALILFLSQPAALHQNGH